ncbi:3-phosphate acyltransferase, chloroplastic [Seminavis robusta]|uniref:3-phosphate acyltransferase, chloroplastic n=1 Tax=Seminavis robusta TaxID=568900 RepID=A0A9N8H747_9STRA|nr:3-phosphate acyltransferase, chloroplastic [Seminavis robusta]|eukprot:Sro60_g034470.1 3-phosphate acyltransferase, chloroplastic (390) ;mRNA; r:5275-6444
MMFRSLILFALVSSTSAFSAVAPSKVGAKVDLDPEYAATLEGATAKMGEALGDKKEKLLPMLKHFVGEYLGAAQVGREAAPEDQKDFYAPQAAAGRIMQGILYAQQFGMPDSPDLYTFDVTHTALRGDAETEDGNTVDYYGFGCDFFRPCMDLENSVVLGQDNLKKAMEQLANGDNVIFFANHQSEADPQVVSCLMEKAGYAEQAADMVYVAGHKVTTDPLAIPFSMGRNLICIHSKKHINADPDTKSKKQRQNLQAMSAMLKKFKKGGCLLWVAPSGGRDRRDLETGEVPPAPFDSKTIDMFRLMGNKSKKPMHYYPMAMVSYDLCPPPDYVEAGVGEQRNVRFVPVGIEVGEETESVGGLESRKEFCKQAFQTCLEGYDELNKALEM